MATSVPAWNLVIPGRMNQNSVKEDPTTTHPDGSQRIWNAMRGRVNWTRLLRDDFHVSSSCVKPGPLALWQGREEEEKSGSEEQDRGLGHLVPDYLVGWIIDRGMWHIIHIQDRIIRYRHFTFQLEQAYGYYIGMKRIRLLRLHLLFLSFLEILP